MRTLTRQFQGSGRRAGRGEHLYYSGAAGVRPIDGGALTITAPMPMSIPGGLPYVGLDPSNPATWARPYNPQGGMIAFLNFNGAAAQGRTPTGGVWKNPASANTLAGARPARRPR
jgi:hypothetical protein